MNHLSLWRRLGILLLLAACAPHAVAAESRSECISIRDPQARLECFDRVSGTPPEVTGKPPAAPAARAVQARASMIDEAWGFAPDAPEFLLRYYRPNYILPVSYSDEMNQEPFSPIFEATEPDLGLDDIEARFQISFKSRLWSTEDRRWGAWIAYTQQSQWQVYSEDTSRPFRETNYMPEVFATYRPDVEFGGWRWGLLKFGYNHQSNGRSQLLSRSWDRLVVEAGLERDNLGLHLRAWYRIEEDRDEDDNPDITDYLGYSELTGLYRHGGHSVTLMGRGNWRTGKGAAQLNYMSPPLLGALRGYLRVFSGYGDSMIDYNWNQTVVGIGVSLNDGF